MDFYRFCKNNILQTTAVLIVLLDLPIIIQTHAEFCIKQQIYINDLSKKWASALIPIELHTGSHFRWLCAKA